jgi:hypothetical protein
LGWFRISHCWQGRDEMWLRCSDRTEGKAQDHNML